jgi:hypothetical protein
MLLSWKSQAFKGFWNNGDPQFIDSDFFFSKTWNWWFSDAETLKKSEPAVHSNDHTTLIHNSLHISQTQSGNASLPPGASPPTHQLPNVLGNDEITFRRQLLLLYLLSLACTYTGSLVIMFTSPPHPKTPPPSSPSSVAQLQH